MWERRTKRRGDGGRHGREGGGRPEGECEKGKDEREREREREREMRLSSKGAVTGREDRI